MVLLIFHTLIQNHGIAVVIAHNSHIACGTCAGHPVTVQLVDAGCHIGAGLNGCAFLVCVHSCVEGVFIRCSSGNFVCLCLSCSQAAFHHGGLGLAFSIGGLFGLCAHSVVQIGIGHVICFVFIKVAGQFIVGIGISVLNGLGVLIHQSAHGHNVTQHGLGHAVAVCCPQEFLHAGIAVVGSGVGQTVHGLVHALLAFLAQRKAVCNGLFIQTFQILCVLHSLRLEVIIPGLAGFVVFHAGGINSVIAVRAGNIGIEIVHGTHGERSVIHRRCGQLVNQAAVQHKNGNQQNCNQNRSDGPATFALFVSCFLFALGSSCFINTLLPLRLTSFLFA